PLTDLPAHAETGRALSISACLTTAGVAVGSSPNRTAAAPAAIGAAKLVAHPVGPVPPPLVVVMLFWVGTARSTIVGLYSPQSCPSVGDDVLTQRMLDAGSPHGRRSRSASWPPSPLPPG